MGIQITVASELAAIGSGVAVSARIAIAAGPAVRSCSKLLRNPQLQIDTAPTYHAIPLKVRTLLDPVCHSGLLFG